MSDLLWTLPKVTAWEMFQKELDLIADGSHTKNIFVKSYPLKASVGNNVYITYKDILRGYLKIVAFQELNFQCLVTNKVIKGKVISLSGKWNAVEPIEIVGFRGYRYFDHMLFIGRKNESF